MNLLIADDESIIRKGLSSIPWNEYGITLLSPACDGLSAKVTIETETVDILLTDIRMPGLDGLELAAKLWNAIPTPASSFCPVMQNLNMHIGPSGLAQSAIF